MQRVSPSVDAKQQTEENPDKVLSQFFELRQLRKQFPMNSRQSVLAQPPGATNKGRRWQHKVYAEAHVVEAVGVGCSRRGQVEPHIFSYTTRQEPPQSSRLRIPLFAQGKISTASPQCNPVRDLKGFLCQ